MAVQIEYKGSIEGWCVNQCNRNKWRVPSYVDFEDMMQDTRLLFTKCYDRYIDAVENERHFMSLFQRAVINHFNDLSVKGSDSLLDDYAFEDSDDSPMMSIMGDTNTDGFLRTLIQEAPREVRDVVNFFQNAPDELLEQAESAWSDNGRRKYMSNATLCEMLGYDSSRVDLVKQTRAYFSNEN